MGANVTPLFPEPARETIPRSRPGEPAWACRVRTELLRSSRRFEGRPDMERSQRFLLDCAALLPVHEDPATYVQNVTRVRWTAVQALCDLMATDAHLKVHGMARRNLPVIRDLHQRVLAAAEGI